MEGSVHALITHQALLKQFVLAKFGVKLGAATIVHHFHLCHRNWFSQQWQLTAVSTLLPPNLKDSFDTFGSTHTTTWRPCMDHIKLLQRLTHTPAKQPAAPVLSADKAPAIKPLSKKGLAEDRAERKRVNDQNRDPRFMGETPLRKRSAAAPSPMHLPKLEARLKLPQVECVACRGT